jgi:hypothetical protein
MKVLDPQSALLTNAEVYDFLKSNEPRKADRNIGAYEPVDLKGYVEVRQDVRKFCLCSQMRLLVLRHLLC